MEQYMNANKIVQTIIFCSMFCARAMDHNFLDHDKTTNAIIKELESRIKEIEKNEEMAKWELKKLPDGKRKSFVEKDPEAIYKDYLKESEEFKKFSFCKNYFSCSIKGD